MKLVDGILIIDKPAGITSHDVVYKVRRILKTKRVGHTGTLDPFATGVMVVLVGQATRLAQFLDKDEKAYEATVRFGLETDTGDLTGVRSAGCGMRTGEISEVLNNANWENVFDEFRGNIQQVPPMYSAKKVDGKKLYELARKGETVERKPVAVTIAELELSEPPALAGGLDADDINLEHGVRSSPPAYADGSDRSIRVVCSAGTYIRTLAEDIGKKLGIGAHLTALRRTSAGQFGIADAIALDDLAAKEDPSSSLVPMETAVSHLPKIVLNEERAAKTKNGLSTRVFETGFGDGEPVRILNESEKLIAIGYFNAAENVVQPKVVLV
jgi:tRNA pseudouridine55 synthase